MTYKMSNKMKNYIDNLLVTKKCPIYISIFTLNNEMEINGMFTYEEIENIITNYLSKYNDNRYKFIVYSLYKFMLCRSYYFRTKYCYFC